MEKKNKAIVVFTGRTIAMLLNKGGSSSWKLNRNKAADYPFVVCTRNRNPSEKWNWPEGEGEHHCVFLVARIKDVVRDPERETRFLIKFSEYATVGLPDHPIWKEGHRNPVRYSTLEDCGIELDKLKWQSMAISEVQSLSIKEAKPALAKYYDVPIENIEIMIRG